MYFTFFFPSFAFGVGGFYCADITKNFSATILSASFQIRKVRFFNFWVGAFEEKQPSPKK